MRNGVRVVGDCDVIQCVGGEIVNAYFVLHGFGDQNEPWLCEFRSCFWPVISAFWSTRGPLRIFLDDARVLDRTSI